jgi:hypothetical protein
LWLSLFCCPVESEPAVLQKNEPKPGGSGRVLARFFPFGDLLGDDRPSR